VDGKRIQFSVCQPLRDGALFDFYARNNICEQDYGKELAEAVLKHKGVWAAAYDAGRLIGFARALYDGTNAQIMEIDLDLEYQSGNEFDNGCFIEGDPHGIARELALALIAELRRRGCFFFSYTLFEDSAERKFYESLGFYENTGHKQYIIDARPYVPGGTARGAMLDAQRLSG
jgi:hypothetical protein